MIEALDDVILTCDLPEHGLSAGDIGTAVLVHRGAAGTAAWDSAQCDLPVGRAAIVGNGDGWRLLRYDILPFKSEASTIEVFRDGLNADPSSIEALGGLAGAGSIGFASCH